jgi:Arc/MetJ-type ribon-helix-helix transcriptional regulator
MTRIGEQLENLVNEKVASGLFQSSDQAVREIETLLAREAVQRSLKQAREDIETGNLFDAETVFEELRKTDT